MYIYTYIYIYIHIYVYACMYIYICLYMYKHMHLYTHLRGSNPADMASEGGGERSGSEIKRSHVLQRLL